MKEKNAVWMLPLTQYNISDFISQLKKYKLPHWFIGTFLIGLWFHPKTQWTISSFIGTLATASPTGRNFHLVYILLQSQLTCHGHFHWHMLRLSTTDDSHVYIILQVLRHFAYVWTYVYEWNLFWYRAYYYIMPIALYDLLFVCAIYAIFFS